MNDMNYRKELIEKLYKGTCTKREVDILFRMLQNSSEPPPDHLLQKLWEYNESASLDEDISSRILQNTLHKIQNLEEHKEEALVVPTKTSPSNRKFTKYQWAGVAASLLFLIVAVTLFVLPKSSKAVVQTEYGERHSVELFDGSKVQLNANTQISYRKSWGDHESREVWLSGEAFFEVLKKPETNQDFRVRTDDVTIEVLGTSFNVNSHRNQTRVYLEEGDIRLHIIQLDTVIQMKPGDLVIYRKLKGDITIKHAEQTELYTSWKDGVLTFKGAPLIKVLEKIEEIYGVQFEIIDSIDRTKEITFPLPIHELDKAISILQKTIADIEIQKTGDKYVVK